MQGGRARSSGEIMNSADISYDPFTDTDMAGFYGAYMTYERDEADSDPFAAKERAHRKPFWTRPQRTPLPELQEWRSFTNSSDTPDEENGSSGIVKFSNRQLAKNDEKSNSRAITDGEKSNSPIMEINFIKLGLSVLNQIIMLIFIFAIAVAVSMYVGIQIGKCMNNVD